MKALLKASTHVMTARAVLAMTLTHFSLQGTAATGSDAPSPERETQDESKIVATQQHLLESGVVTFEWREGHGYLESVLEAFEVPLSSQLLVFSKTSQLRDHISPQNPRAVYFNDEVYVAWVPGTPHIEIAAVEPKVGSVFYMLEQNKNQAAKIESSVQCLECHTSNRNLSIPGPIVRSFPTDSIGAIERNNGVSAVNHTTPLKYRWGGWYATGKTKMPHRGNRFGATNKAEKNSVSLTDLKPFLDTKKYPTDSSDMVALLVLEHQAHMQNLITRLDQDAVIAMKRDGNIHSLRDNATQFLKYLLFIDEAPIESPISGNTGFAKQFQTKGKMDSNGRSLRSLNLETRLLEYPCSYLIYSAGFQQMQPMMSRHLLRRLHDILTGNDETGEFDKLTPDQRKSILEIITETVDKLPTYWTL
jgi:hypothetical protein